MNIPYIRSGDYFIPDLKLQEETRPIGKWGRMHRKYLKEHHPVQFNNLVLSGNLWTYLADLNEQAQQRMDTLFPQLKSAEGITEELKAADPMKVIPRRSATVLRNWKSSSAPSRWMTTTPSLTSAAACAVLMSERLLSMA